MSEGFFILKDYTDHIFKKVISKNDINFDEAKKLFNEDTYTLSNLANKIRQIFCGAQFDFCAIVNAKSGICGENCKFCAQSSFYNTSVQKYKLDEHIITKSAESFAKSGIKRFSIVTSGKALNNYEIDKICEISKNLSKNINICVSGGLLSFEQFKKLKSANINRIHCNIETSKNHFSSICTTHTYNDKILTIKNAQKAGIEVCSGGIIGIGESIDDRIDMAISLRELNIKSVPINILNPIKGTPLENIQKISYNDVIKTVSIFRFIMPKAFIRIAGGRLNLCDSGKELFKSGANAAITGDMLTTNGVSFKNDIKIVTESGFNINTADIIF